MVKAENERDYYADLELEPSATANDVKKQFKKLALQYHPDRNPSGNTTAKFQAIQSATEVLTDPQQRAKYDAQRIRSGLLHTYTDSPPPPPRNNPSRYPPGFSNFPPPPRPPPTGPKKATFSSPPSGAQKYARFNTPDSQSWRAKDTDDAKSKTNDFKAWEHMRHGQGPIPRGRKETKPASFQPERERYDHSEKKANNTMPKRTTPRRTEWENLPDAGMPNIKRSSTAHMPPKSFTYAPSTPGVGGDEPQARSAFFNVSRERPTPSRAQTNMPPPPPPSTAARAPTAKRPDPSVGANGPFNDGHRVRTNYPTMHGEKTNLSPGPGLHRSTTSATPRDSNSRTGFRESDSLRANGHHVRSASANSPYRDRKAAGMASRSTTSSESSSDEEETAQKKQAANLSKSAFGRPKQQPKTRRPHMGAGAPQRSFFNPYVTVDEAQDEPMVSDAAYSGPRRHSGIEFPTHKRADDPPEGFMEHRKKHEGTHPNHQGADRPIGSNLPHFLQRPKSFDEKYRRPTQEEETRPRTANMETTPMYGQGYNPFSFPVLPLDLSGGAPPFGASSGRWSEYWPFGPRTKPEYARVEMPPYWAIPSTVPAFHHPYASKNSCPTPELHVNPSAFNATNANLDPFASFRWPSGDLPRPFVNTNTPRSQSFEDIDVEFSPAGTPPRFGGGNASSTKPSAGDTSTNPFEIFDSEGLPSGSNGQEDDSASEKTPCGPPPKGPACFFPNDWHQRAWAGTFQAEPGRSPSRASSQRRAGPARTTTSSNAAKRAGPQRAPENQPSVNDVEDEPPSYNNATGENLNSSRVSSEGSAMDIDPVLTPPSGNDNQHLANSNDVSPTRPNGPTKTSNQAPILPPRTAIPVHSGEDSLNIGLGDFQHVKPFASNRDGLGSVDDLSQALPFESRASSNRPLTTEKPLQSMKMPKPPKAPSPPRPLNPTTWKSYVDAMSSYMRNWTNFNNTMLSHFHIRQETTTQKQQLNPGWMSAQGDGEFTAYMESLVEDEKMRKWWEVACDHHRECMGKLGEVRVAMKEEAQRARDFPYPA